MQYMFALVTFFSISMPAFASPVPEIDGALGIQIAALVGGLAILIRKKR
ncbi:exported hypothetical protein [Gammaproteobacteria bacterium]